MRIEHIRPNIKSQGFDVRWPSDYEAGHLVLLAQRNDMVEAFEIGTGNGFVATCLALAGLEVYTFDYKNRYKIYEHPAWGEPEATSRVHFRQVKSPDCFHFIHPTPQKTMFFIDGEKGYNPSWRDFKETLKVARPNDIIVVIDVRAEKKVERFWKEVQSQYPDKTETLKTENGLGIYHV